VTSRTRAASSEGEMPKSSLAFQPRFPITGFGVLRSGELAPEHVNLDPTPRRVYQSSVSTQDDDSMESILEDVRVGENLISAAAIVA